MRVDPHAGEQRAEPVDRVGVALLAGLGLELDRDLRLPDGTPKRAPMQASSPLSRGEGRTDSSTSSSGRNDQTPGTGASCDCFYKMGDPHAGLTTGAQHRGGRLMGVAALGFTRQTAEDTRGRIERIASRA